MTTQSNSQSDDGLTQSHDDTLDQIVSGVPMIIPEQRFTIRDKDGKLVRGERVLMIHPDLDAQGDRRVVVEGTRGTSHGKRPGDIHAIKEYNLRRLFKLEGVGPLPEETRNRG